MIILPRYRYSLAEFGVRHITPPDGVLLDLFAGSATIGVAALKNGFRYIGIEQKQEYYQESLERLKETVASMDSIL